MQTTASNCWRDFQARHKCLHKLFLDAFGEECIQDSNMHSVSCCDVCKINPQLADMTEELRLLVDAITVVGSKGEVKIVQWIHGSLQWTSE